jgi:predicted DNA-binding protein
VAGKAVTVCLSPYIYDQLIKVSEKRGLTKTAIVSIAVEKYARELEREERRSNEGK